jgi:hypothetical protein
MPATSRAMVVDNRMKTILVITDFFGTFFREEGLERDWLLALSWEYSHWRINPRPSMSESLHDKGKIVRHTPNISSLLGLLARRTTLLTVIITNGLWLIFLF